MLRLLEGFKGVILVLPFITVLVVSCADGSSGTSALVEPETPIRDDDGADTPGEEPSPPSESPPSDEPDDSRGHGDIRNLQTLVLSPVSAEVIWDTSHFGTSEVRLGTTSALANLTVAEGRPDRYHRVLLSDLDPGSTYYYQAVSVSEAGSSASPVGSFSVPDPDPLVVRNEHPRIFFTSEDLPELTSRIQGTHASYWRSLDSYCSKALAESATSLASDSNSHLFTQAFAFAAVLGGNPSYVRKAEEIALASAGLSLKDNFARRRSLVICSLVYDWLYDHLSSSSKSTLRTGILNRMASLTTNDREFLWGWNPEKFSPLTIGGLALYHEASEARECLEKCVYRYRHSIFPPWRHFARTGGTMEGWWYSGFHVDFFLDAMLALRSGTNVDFFQTETWLDDLANWFCLGMRNDNSFHRMGDVWIHRGFASVNRRFGICVARYFGNQHAQWLAKKVEETTGVWGPTAVSDILLYQPDVEAIPLSGRTGGFFPDPGCVLEAGNGGTEAVKVTFRCAREFTLGHTHLDSNSFTIYYKGGQALDAGIYDRFSSDHHLNYYSRTIAHNTITVFDPNETFRRYSQYLDNDGGQQFLRAPSQVEYVMPGSIEDILDPSKGYQQGGIHFYESTDSYTYAMGDAAPAYSADKLEAFDRHFLFLREVAGFDKPVTVVFDYVVSTRAELEKAYLLHTEGAPTIRGTLVSATNDGGMLYQQTVLPSTARIVAIGGAGREYWVRGRNCAPERPPKQMEEAGKYRVEVYPATPAATDFFLHVLHATDAGSAAPPLARSLNAVGMRGITLADRVILFPAGADPVEATSYSIAADSWTHLLCGMVPTGSYDVLLDGSWEGLVKTSQEGTLHFDTSNASSVTLRYRG